MNQVGENEVTGRLHFERIDQCADRVIVTGSRGYGIVSKAFYIDMITHFLKSDHVLFAEYPSDNETLFGIHDFPHADGTLENGCNDFAVVSGHAFVGIFYLLKSTLGVFAIQGDFPDCSPIRVAIVAEGSCVRMIPFANPNLPQVNRCLNETDGVITWYTIPYHSPRVLFYNLPFFPPTRNFSLPFQRTHPQYGVFKMAKVDHGPEGPRIDDASCAAINSVALSLIAGVIISAAV
jgi:hypothetical protein